MVVIKKHKPQRKRRSGSYGFMARLGIVGAYSAFMVLLGAVLQKQSFYGSVLRPIVEANVRLPVHYVKSRQVRPDRLDLDISMRNLGSNAMSLPVMRASIDRNTEPRERPGFLSVTVFPITYNRLGIFRPDGGRLLTSVSRQSTSISRVRFGESLWQDASNPTCIDYL